jgi:hypothetical protein
MQENHRDDLLGREYRANQSRVASVLLAESVCDLFQEITHFCVKNRIQRDSAMEGVVSEMRSLIDRLNEINSLPMSELLRIPPLELSPKPNSPQKSPRDRTEPHETNPGAIHARDGGIDLL